MELPTLIPSLNGYTGASIDLSGKKFKIGPNYDVERDDTTHEIGISGPIILHKVHTAQATTLTAQIL